MATVNLGGYDPNTGWPPDDSTGVNWDPDVDIPGQFGRGGFYGAPRLTAPASGPPPGVSLSGPGGARSHWSDVVPPTSQPLRSGVSPTVRTGPGPYTDATTPQGGGGGLFQSPIELPASIFRRRRSRYCSGSPQAGLRLAGNTANPGARSFRLTRESMPVRAADSMSASLSALLTSANPRPTMCGPKRRLPAPSLAGRLRRLQPLQLRRRRRWECRGLATTMAGLQELLSARRRPRSLRFGLRISAAPDPLRFGSNRISAPTIRSSRFRIGPMRRLKAAVAAAAGLP